MGRNLEEFNDAHMMGNCFIVGSGPSICDYDLSILKERVVIAVNSGYLAVPWASYFLSDDWSVSRWSYFYKDLRHSDKTVALLYEDKLKNTSSWFGDRAVLFRHRKGINIPDKYVHQNKLFHIGETRSSVGSAIMVAHIMGCSKIFLIGIDGCRQNGFRYFWQISSSFGSPKRNDGVSLDKYAKVKSHGEITDYDLLDINRSWDKFGKAVNEKCEVYNCSEISKLKVFPKTTFAEAVQ